MGAGEKSKVRRQIAEVKPSADADPRERVSFNLTFAR
jgi:hypothetical protein